MKTVLDEYCNEQLQILKDFCVELTSEQIEYIKSLTSEIAIENYKRMLLGIEHDVPRAYYIKMEDYLVD